MSQLEAPIRSVPAPPAPGRPALLPWLTYLLLLPLIGLATAFFGAISLLCSLWDRDGHQQHLVARAWARVLLLISMSRVTLIGAEHLRAHPTAVYAANHTSYYDTPVLFANLPFQFRIMAKHGLWKVPFIGWHLKRSGQVAIDQKSARSAVAGLLRGAKTLKAGLPLVLFPEGGRTATGVLQPMASGSAFMAIKAQVPLVPVALVGTYELLPIHTYYLTPRPLLIVIGEPIPTTGLDTKDAEALTTRLHQAIADLFYLHSQNPVIPTGA